MKDTDNINPDKYDKIMSVISKEYIENKDFEYVQNFYNQMLENPTKYENKVILIIQGYDDDPRELFEINEVREYFSTLDKLFPYWFYFIYRKIEEGYSSLKLIMLLLVPCEVIDLNNGKKSIEYDLKEYAKFIKIHFHYFNELTDKLNMTLEENKRICSEIYKNYN